MKKHQVALLFLLAVSAAISVGCGSSNSAPTFSKMAMYSERTVTPATNLFTMNLDGSGVTPVQTGATGSIWGLSVSADFQTATYETNDEVWVINPSSGSPTQLTQSNNNSSGFPYYSVRVSPNGQKILSPVFDSSGNASLWVMNADGTGSTNLTATLPTGMSNCYIGNFSADSSEIAFACSNTSFSSSPTSFGLYTMKTDGSQMATVLTQSSGIDCPSFAPNGQQILYITWGTPGAELKRGSNHIASSYRQLEHPEVSVPTNPGIVSVNLDGSNSTVVVSAPTAIYESEILNSNLYYVTYDSNEQFYQIFKANLDGSSSAAISEDTESNILAICGYCGG